MEARLAFLRKHDNIMEENGNVGRSTLPLKILTLHRLFEDASYDELLSIQKFVNDQFRARGTDIEVALKAPDSFLTQRGISPLYRELLRLICIDFLTTNYAQITEIQRDNAIALWKPSITLSYKRPIHLDIVCDNLQERCGMSEEELAIFLNDITEITEFMHDYDYDYDEQFIRGNYHEQFIQDGMCIPQLVNNNTTPPFPARYYDYVSTDITNPYVIAAVEKLRSEGVPVSDVIITTIRVPLNKKIKQCFDNKFGEYVELIDK